MHPNTYSVREKWPGEILYVECPQDWTVLFATELFLFGDSEIAWDDLSKRRGFEIENIQEERDAVLVVKRKKDDRLPISGGVYTFQRLTLDLYANVLKERLGWSRSFSTVEELRAYILTQIATERPLAAS
jgi:hypothetical protein